MVQLWYPFPPPQKQKGKAPLNNSIHKKPKSAKGTRKTFSDSKTFPTQDFSRLSKLFPTHNFSDSKTFPTRRRQAIHGFNHAAATIHSKKKGKEKTPAEPGSPPAPPWNLPLAIVRHLAAHGRVLLRRGGTGSCTASTLPVVLSCKVVLGSFHLPRRKEVPRTMIIAPSSSGGMIKTPCHRNLRTLLRSPRAYCGPAHKTPRRRLPGRRLLGKRRRMHPRMRDPSRSSRAG